MTLPSSATALFANIAKYHDGKYSDFTITCGAREWKVHKFMLTVSSPVLEKNCHGGFKESVESKLDLSEYTEAEIDALVCYIYTLNYSVPESEPDENDYCPGSLPLHVGMSIIGDYFDMHSLTELAKAGALNVVYSANMDDIIETAGMTAEVPGPTDWILRSIATKASAMGGGLGFQQDAFNMFQVVAANPVLIPEIARYERPSRLLTQYGAIERMVCTRDKCEKDFADDCNAEKCRKVNMVYEDPELLRRCFYCGKEGLGVAKFMHSGYWPEDFDEDRDGWLHGAEIAPGQDGRGWRERFWDEPEPETDPSDTGDQ